MHSLLKRQIKRFWGEADALPRELMPLFDAISTAYEQNDIDRAMIERSLDIASQEMLAQNHALANELKERRAAESRLEQSLSILNTTLNSTGDGILVVGNDRNVEGCNDKFIDMWRIPASLIEQRDDRRLLDFVAGQLTEPAGFLQDAETLFASGDDSFDLVELKDGRIFERYSQPRRLGGVNVGRVFSFRDITDRYKAEKTLAYLSNHDQLTGLVNRSLLSDRITQAIASASRRNRQVAILFLDLDHFKMVNDSLGHSIGDELLKVMADRLAACVRCSDTVARLGGDEFVLVVTEQSLDGMTAEMACGIDAPATHPHVMNILQRILNTVSKPVTLGGHELHVTCSIGASLYPEDGEDADLLLKNADAAMYSAKQLGRNNFQFYTADLTACIAEKLSLLEQLRHALRREEFVLHYQPQVDLHTGRIVGMEALIRWNHPTLEQVSPARFIGLAEEAGLIVPIGAWMIRTACHQAKAWQCAGYGDLRIAVNLSMRQFTQAGLVQSIADMLADTELNPQFLEIELTENIVMSEVEQSIVTLRKLKALGVQLSIGDFGTGYSSLSYLKRFPVDILKIDKSFIHDVTTDADDAAISKVIISMAHSLGIRVIADGVETEAQCEFLRMNMCDEIQGAFFSPSLTAANTEALLREGRQLPDHLLHQAKRSRTLLLVDDEANIISALKRLLRAEGYRILTASSASVGLEMLAQEHVDVIVSDQRMPGMTGVEFLRAVKEKYPDTVRIVLSGYTELQSVIDAVNEGAIYQFLVKPWDDAQLRRHIAEAFRHKELSDENRRLALDVQTSNQYLASVNRQLQEILQLKQDEPARGKSHP